jgi:hypothetical protein
LHPDDLALLGKTVETDRSGTGLARWGAITLFKAKFRAEKNQELN